MAKTDDVVAEGFRALARLREMGASRTLVSLTHAQGHAAAAVLFLRDPP